MNDESSERGGDEPDRPDPGAIGKQIEKVKADNEKFPSDKLLKPEVKEKEEFKEHKNELKELKPEKEKPEFKEGKNELKEFKREKEKPEKEGKDKIEVEKRPFEKQVIEKPNIKEGGKSEFEKPPGSEGPILDRDSLIKHAEALEESARQLRHFIDKGERPDLGGGALRDEPDQGGEG